MLLLEKEILNGNENFEDAEAHDRSEEDRIERHPDLGFACSRDGRLMWKIVRRRVESVS